MSWIICFDSGGVVFSAQLISFFFFSSFHSHSSLICSYFYFIFSPCSYFYIVFKYIFQFSCQLEIHKNNWLICTWCFRFFLWLKYFQNFSVKCVNFFSLDFEFMVFCLKYCIIYFFLCGCVILWWKLWPSWLKILWCRK